MQWRAGPVVLAAVLLVVSGLAGAALAAPAVQPATPRGGLDTGGVAPAATNHTPPDPQADVIGWEGGYWHNESIAIDQSDGLSAAELDAYVFRAMARVEFVREREFNRSVPVEVISRDAYRNRTENQTRGGNFSAWNNQVWEALFIVGEDKDVQQELETVYGTAVAGFYAPEDDEIKIITETPDEPVLDNATLLHELVHAMQDQSYNISQQQYQGSTQDAQLAASGLIEGEANYIERRYSDRCGDEWECVASSAQGPREGGPEPNLGILVTIFNPYSDGPVYINSLLTQGGWAAVNATFANPPVSTEQVIHVSDEEPVPIEYEDVAQNGWGLFADQGVNGSDTAGEASIYAMFWYQASHYRANTISPNELFNRIQGTYDTYNYDAEPSAGWGNDRVFPYHKEVENETRYGYVWVTRWDTTADADQFQQAYLRILESHDATRVGVRTWRIEDGPFADVFRIDREGTRVTIINGPTMEALADIRPDIEYQPLQTPTVTRTPTTDPTTVEGSDTPSLTRPVVTAPGQSGFGVLAAVAVLVAGLLARRRRD